LGPLLLLALHVLTLLGELPATLGQLREADCLGLVGVEQTPVGPRGRKALELGLQLRWLGEQTGDVLPDGALNRLRLDGAAWAD
jgi:hypothetical protein